MAALVPFHATVAALDGTVRVEVVGELDCASAPQLGRLLADLVDDRRDLVVDLRSTEFVDCAGIDVLAVAYDRCRRQGGGFVLEAPSSAAVRVLELTGLAQYIPTTDDPDCQSAGAAP